MITKGNKMYSIVNNKCPRCHEGSLFESNAYSMHFYQMPEKCNACNLSYYPEPGFYSGAMYVTYGLQVALLTSVYIALRLLFNPGLGTYVITFLASVVLLAPLLFRMSRAIYINFFHRYQQDLSISK